MSRLVIACLAATWVIWGSTYLAIRFALVSFPPYLQMGNRFLVAGLGLALWMRFARGAPWPDGRQWRNALLVGALMLAGGMGSVAVAEQTVGAGIGVGLAGVLMLTRGPAFQASPAGLLAMLLAGPGNARR